MPCFRMNRLIPLLTVALMVLAISFYTPDGAVAQEGLNDVERSEVETLIQEYLLENPEVLIDAIQALRDKQELDRLDQEMAAVEDFNLRLSQGLNAPSVGRLDASVTMVEFFDYQCVFCKRVFPDMQKLMETDDDIRFVFMEFPILGENSVTASNAAMAVWLNWPEQYLAVHKVLMSSRGSLTTNKIIELVASTGVDPKALQEAMNSPEVEKLIRENYDLADSMNINGTPTFIIGDELVPGAIDMTTMKRLIDAARNS